MIVAIASLDDHYKTHLSANLAVLRARSGRNICLIDTDPQECAYSWGCDRSIAAQAPSVMSRALSGPMLSREIENQRPSYGTSLINTGRCHRHEMLSALIAARLVIMPVSVDQADIDVH
jgi:chromosome partitioning protein